MRSSRPHLRAALLCTAALAAAGASCSSSRSFIVLTLQSKDGAAIPGVHSVIVTVTKGGSAMSVLTYPAPGGTDLTLDAVTDNNLSVNFSGSESGDVTLSVDARDKDDCTIATGATPPDMPSGAAPPTIKKNEITKAVVLLTRTHDCTHGDGGTDGGDAAFPGCDPVPPTSCGANMTCFVNCTSGMGECTAAGNVPPGQTCGSNNDCTPGSQCFNYGQPDGGGCPVKLCLQFCATTSQCAQPGDGGVGPGSLCAGPVVCNGTPTGRHTCTFSCDPRRVAVTGGTSGCPTGLSCLVIGDMDQVDCTCPESRRTKTDGQDCNPLAPDCAPGFVCNKMSGTNKCRAVCRCDATGTTCTASAGDCPTGQTCQALTNDTRYGVCL